MSGMNVQNYIANNHAQQISAIALALWEALPDDAAEARKIVNKGLTLNAPGVSEIARQVAASIKSNLPEIIASEDPETARAWNAAGTDELPARIAREINYAAGKRLELEYGQICGDWSYRPILAGCK